jgi:DNA-directed RNA polymerase specialized sigma24 family protein
LIGCNRFEQFVARRFDVLPTGEVWPSDSIIIMGDLEKLREQREAFVLQVDSGLTVEQIASITGTTFETAKSRLRYARDRLKELLREHA